MGRGSLGLGLGLLETSRLPIVFDLDETLLVAYSLHTLDVRLQKLRDGCAFFHCLSPFIRHHSVNLSLAGGSRATVGADQCGSVVHSALWRAHCICRGLDVSSGGRMASCLWRPPPCRRDRGAGAEEEAAALARDRQMLHDFATTDSISLPRPNGGVERVYATCVLLLQTLCNLREEEALIPAGSISSQLCIVSPCPQENHGHSLPYCNAFARFLSGCQQDANKLTCSSLHGLRSRLEEVTGEIRGLQKHRRWTKTSRQ